jgi:hypothetical protein
MYVMRRLRPCWVAIAAIVCTACGGSSSGSPGGDAGTDACVGATCGNGGQGQGTCSALQWPQPAGCTATEVEGKLRCVAGVTVTPRPDVNVPGYRRFDLVVTQPLDHDHPEAGTFEQRVALLHTSDTAPVVLFVNGYGLPSEIRLNELSRLYTANQIYYEHRFFAASRPVPTDWSKLDIRQAELDAHHIAEVLHWLYPGRWVNTGGSKGGITSVIHRRFHPCDVDATVAYVAPVSVSAADPAYTPFLQQVGGSSRAACRDAITALQRRLLERRDDIVPLVQGSFTALGADRAFEVTTLELSFVFWQYTNPDDPELGCSALPGDTASPAELLAFLEGHGSVNGSQGDGAIDYYHAYFHQSAAQLGYPAAYEAPLADLMRFPGADVPATYLPAGEVTMYDPVAMADVADWVKNQGEQMMFIYGALDPWSARPFTASSKDSHTFVVAGGNHGSNLSQLSATDRSAALALLSRWLDAPVPTAASAARPSSVRPADREDLTGAVLPARATFGR